MATSSVNRPTNVQQRDADVAQKLQLYGMVNAFANGKVPSNRQIDIALNSALASKALGSPSNKLSSEGQALVGDLRDVVEKAKILLLSKNEGNLIQDFIWQTQNITGANASLPGAPVDKETAKQHGNQALEGLRTLGTLIITNGQFRKLLSDATVLFRDMAGDAAQKAANKVNPSDEQLAQIDRPAADNTWHDVPDVSTGNLKSQAKGLYEEKSPIKKQDLKDAAGDATQHADPSGSRDPNAVANRAADEQQQGTGSGIDATGGAVVGAQSLVNKASDNMDDETKENIKNTARDKKYQAKDYLSSKMPQERRDQTIWRLKKMIVEIQGHEDYQQAIETLLSLAETYGGHANKVTGQTAGAVKGAHTDDALTLAERDLKTLLERFANSTSVDDFLDAINNIYTDAANDPELKKWFESLDAFVRKCLQQQGFVLEDSSTDEWNRIYDHGNFLLRDRYRDHTDRIIDEANHMADQFNRDPHNKAFADSMNKLFTDLGTDENGKATFKPHLVKDLTSVIIPSMFESVSYIPVPRLEYSDPQVDAIIENLIVEGDNLLPNALEIASDNYFKWGRKTVASRNKNKVMISVSGVQMDLKDVSYYIHKKQGFPSIKDKGVMDIFMGGTGFSFKIAMETADDSTRQHFFKVNTVKVDIKNMKLKLKQSHYKLLFNLVKPLLLGIVKPAITKLLEKQIRDYVTKADAYCYEIYKEANRAAEIAKNDPEQAQNIYQRYVTAAQQKIASGKQKAADTAANKEAKVAMSQHDSLFPDIKLPGGISTKATEYKELAGKGEKWESPIFSIGTASESNNIPKSQPITRKPHNAASGGVRGPQNIGEDGIAQSNTAQDFNSHVDRSFNDNSAQPDYSLRNTSNGATNGATNGKYTNGQYTTGGNGYYPKTTDGLNGNKLSSGTTLGANNPVLREN